MADPTSPSIDAVLAKLRQWVRSDSEAAPFSKADVEALLNEFQRLNQSNQRLRRQNKRVRIKNDRLKGSSPDAE